MTFNPTPRWTSGHFAGESSPTGPWTSNPSRPSPGPHPLPRIEAAQRLESQRPFWDFHQEFIDKPTIKWQTTTNPDGSLTGLYIQAPYGYYHDLYQNPSSIILNDIAQSMKEQGHEDWAETILKDQVYDTSWSSGSCQSFGFSYNPSIPVDRFLLRGLASWQPYQIGILHPELMESLAEDEKAITPVTSIDGMNMLAAGGIFFGLTGLAGALFAGMGPVGWLTALIGLTAGGWAATVANKKRKKTSNTQDAVIGDRPGYVLKTTTGWIVLLFDSSTHATPKQRSTKAAVELNQYLEQTNDPDKNATIISSYTSPDGLMTFFQSDQPLNAECELSPYKAEQYLSLYAAHQSPKNQERQYKKTEPTVIMGTASLSGIRHQMTAGSYGPNGTSSQWSPEAAMQRAMERFKTAQSTIHTPGSPHLQSPSREHANGHPAPNNVGTPLPLASPVTGTAPTVTPIPGIMPQPQTTIPGTPVMNHDQQANITPEEPEYGGVHDPLGIDPLMRRKDALLGRMQDLKDRIGELERLTSGYQLSKPVMNKINSNYEVIMREASLITPETISMGPGAMDGKLTGLDERINKLEALVGEEMVNARNAHSIGEENRARMVTPTPVENQQPLPSPVPSASPIPMNPFTAPSQATGRPRPVSDGSGE